MKRRSIPFPVEAEAFEMDGKNMRETLDARALARSNFLVAMLTVISVVTLEKFTLYVPL